MSIKDAETGTIREFRLSVHPRLNGRPLACSDPRSVDQHVVEMSDCKQIDRALIPGVTHVAVLFWPVTTMGQAIQVTDEIATL